MKGGYSLVDCTGLDLTKGSTEQTINGLYAALKTALKANKEIIAVGAIVGSGKPASPLSLFVYEYSSSAIYATVSTLQIQVTSSDVVTIVDLTA